MAWLTGDVNNGPGVAKKNNGGSNNNSNSGSSGGSSNSGSPGVVIGTNAPSGSNSSVIVGQSPSNEYNGGTAAEWNYYFGDDEEDTSNDYWDEYLAYQKKVEAAQKAAINAAVQQNVNTLNGQKDTTAQDYADAYRQLYLNNMKSQKNIGQQMAAQGVTGGASESTLLGLNTNYEDNLRQGKVAEQNALSALDQAIANAQLSGSIEAANAAATTGQNTANAYLTAWQQQLAADQAAQQQAASQASENKSYNYQLAMAMLQSGSMPSDTLLNSAGISKADAQTIVAQVAAAKVSSGSGNGAATTSPTDNTYKQTNNYGLSANLATNMQAQADDGTNYFSILNQIRTSLANGDDATSLNKYIDAKYAKGVINSTQAAGLRTLVKNA